MVVSANEIFQKSINFSFWFFGPDNLPYHLCGCPRVIRLYLQPITYLTTLKYLEELKFFETLILTEFHESTAW